MSAGLSPESISHPLITERVFCWTNQMLILILTLKILFALFVGFCLLQILAWSIMGGYGRERKQTLQDDINTARMERNGAMIRQINKARACSDLPSGKFSPEKQAAWNEYQRMDAEDKVLREQENKLL